MEIKTDQFTELAKKELKNERSRLFLKLIPPVMNAKREAGKPGAATYIYNFQISPRREDI